jgi:hypothetical protein
MTIDQIADSIWQLPWYKVVIISIYDDFILLCKMWPVWCIMIGIIVICITSSNWADRWRL